MKKCNKGGKEFERALANGCSVLVAQKGKLIKVHSDRTEEFIRDIEPPIYIKKGTKFTLTKP